MMEEVIISQDKKKPQKNNTDHFGLILNGKGHTDYVLGVHILPDGRFLSWSSDKTLRLWDNQGPPLAVLEGHTSWVREVHILPDGRFLSRSDDKTLRLWDNDGTPLDLLEGHTDEVSGVQILPDGRFLSWSWDITLRLWDNDGAPRVVMGMPKGSKSDPTLLISAPFRLQIFTGDTLIAWVCISEESFKTAKLKDDGKWSKGTSRPGAQIEKVVAALMRFIKKLPEDRYSLRLTVTTPWSVSILAAIPTDLLTKITSLQLQGDTALEEALPFLPEIQIELLRLNLLQRNVLTGLYGISAERLQIYHCPHIENIEGSNCAITEVEIKSAPKLKNVQIEGPMGVAEVVGLTESLS